MLRHNFLPPRVTQELWLRTTCTINGKVCRLIVDPGSFANVISKDIVEKLDIKVEAHPSAYKLAWLNNKIEILVLKQAMVVFSTCSYKDTISCYVVPMDTCHLF